MSSTWTVELADSNPKEHMSLQTPFAQVLLLSSVSRAPVLRVDSNESEMDGNGFSLPDVETEKQVDADASPLVEFLFKVGPHP